MKWKNKSDMKPGEMHDHVYAIYRGCPNRGKPCYCTGECREIIGYGEFKPINNDKDKERLGGQDRDGMDS